MGEGSQRHGKGSGGAHPLAERTFEVPGLLVVPPLAGEEAVGAVAGIASTVVGPRLLLRTTCVDTADLRLTRAGVALVHQSGGRGGATAGAADRVIGPHWHLSLPGVGGCGTAVEVVEPGPLEQPPAPLVELLTPYLRDGELAVAAALRTERTVTLLRAADGSPVVELVDDGVSVLEGRRVAVKHREITLRASDPSLTPLDGPPVDGPPVDGPPVQDADPSPAPAPDPAVVLAEVAQRLVAAGAVEGQHVPALRRALGARGAGAADVPPPVPLQSSSPARAVVAHALRTAASRLMAADTGVRSGAPDGVHQMRVACRRLRSDLGTFAPLVEEEQAAVLREGCRWLAGELGAARDLEVLRERLTASAAADPVAPLDGAQLVRMDTELAEQAAAAGERVLAAVRSDRYRDLLVALVAAAADPPTTPAADARAGDVLPPLVGGAWRRLQRRAARLRPRDPDDVWHEARIRAKRARYAAEAVAPALGKQAASTAAAAARVQEVLGEHQDAATAADVVLGLAAERPDDGAFALTAGRLVERQRAAVLSARAAFPAVWSDVSQQKAVRWPHAEHPERG